MITKQGFNSHENARSKLLLTGASGFVGQNTLPLFQNKFEVLTLGRSSICKNVCDLAESVPVLNCVPEVVFHAAGKAHTLPRNDKEAQAFFDVNLTGTKNLCRALENQGTLPRNFVFISTVAVYGREEGENIAETHPLNGKTPYAKSKIAAENFLREWCEKNGVCLSILRPALIAGPNAPGNLGAMVRGLSTGRYLRIGSGSAKKSVVMVEDLAILAELALDKGGTFNACATEAPNFAQLENLITQQLGKNPPRAIPFILAKLIACVGDCCAGKAPLDSARLRKITGTLCFSNEKARRELGWQPQDILSAYKIGGGNSSTIILVSPLYDRAYCKNVLHYAASRKEAA